MKRENVYSVCGMCTVRCPMMATVAGNKVVYLQGNPHAAGIKGALCARGAAGAALIADDERPQFPMIRAGARGEGKWRKASWSEALEYVAGELSRIRETHGALDGAHDQPRIVCGARHEIADVRDVQQARSGCLDSGVAHSDHPRRPAGRQCRRPRP